MKSPAEIRGRISIMRRELDACRKAIGENADGDVSVLEFTVCLLEADIDALEWVLGEEAVPGLSESGVEGDKRLHGDVLLGEDGGGEREGAAPEIRHCTGSEARVCECGRQVCGDAEGVQGLC